MIFSFDYDVVIPCFNGEAYIEKCISSVMNQSVLPNRIIFIDDGSTDASVEIILEMQKRFPVIEIHKQINRGPSAARNFGIRLSNASLIAFLDVDDFWLPNKIHLQRELIQEKLSFYPFGIASNYSYLDNGRLRPGIRNRKRRKISPRSLLMFKAVIPGSASSVLLPRDILIQCGFFDETLFFGEDLDYWIRVAEKFSWFTVTIPSLVIFANPSGAQSNIRENLDYFFDNSFRIIERFKVHLSGFDRFLVRSYIFCVGERISKVRNNFTLFACLSFYIGIFYGIGIKIERNQLLHSVFRKRES
jgi:glycosyltransferase involved in cell wall biosynthesis